MVEVEFSRILVTSFLRHGMLGLLPFFTLLWRDAVLRKLRKWRAETPWEGRFRIRRAGIANDMAGRGGVFTVRSQGSDGYALMITRKREMSDRSDSDGGPNVVCAVQLAANRCKKLGETMQFD